MICFDKFCFSSYLDVISYHGNKKSNETPLALDPHNSKPVFDPHFLLLENNQHATVKLSATSATLIFQNVKVALDLLPIFLLKFAETFIVPC